MTSHRKIALVGAGYIASTHLEALAQMPGLAISAIVDPDRERAEALARRCGGVPCFRAVEELIDAKLCDTAHVVVPPQAHRSVGEALLKAGRNVFLEKPMATSEADCAALVAAANSARLGINQNFVFHPAFQRLKRALAALGEIHHVGVRFNVQLRQLAARQFGHWMFERPHHILLEQAVHPLSQVVDLIGAVRSVNAMASRPKRFAPDVIFHDTWQIALLGERATSQLFLSFGQDFPVWEIEVIASDGFVVADMINNRVVVRARTRWPDAFDGALTGLSGGAALAAQGVANAMRYVAATAGLAKRSDPFFISMRDSIAAFHQGLDQGAIRVDGRFGLEIVRLCLRIAQAAGIDPAQTPPLRPRRPPESWDVAVLGGSGFIGKKLVERLVGSGRKVAVMARSLKALPEIFDDPAVRLVVGNVARAEDVARAIGPARQVINLAQGASGGSDGEIVASMVDSARAVARACLDKKVTRLVHASTIAALYLGEEGAVITGATPTDSRPDRRAAYARAKAASEAALREMAASGGLELVILRPGVVVGEGGIAFHSALGFFNAEQHCMGWNRGDNPLAFVLVDDVAAAFAAALEAPLAAGRAYNLVGDVAMSAREYVGELGRRLGRPLVFHGQSTAKLFALECGKWLIKRAAGRRDATAPSHRDLRSRGIVSRFDCADAKRDLGWNPVAERARFIELAFGRSETD